MIIFLGIAGSGKSTQGQLLAKHLNYPWLSTGQLLRDHVNDPQITKRMLGGEVLSDDILLPLLDAELKRLDAAHQEVILDGSPRTMYQAQWLADKIKSGEIKFRAVIHLTANETTVKKRLLARHRSDDHEAAIAERFREYEEAIKPIMDYLESQGLTVHNIDGDRPPEVVAAAVNKALGA
jgi:adenylate kinase